MFPLLARIWSSPYDCRLRVNFHCWLRLWLQTSTVSPPILALRLSRQRLLPTWRSLELDSICSHFWWHTHKKKKRYVVSQALQVFVRLYLLLLAFMRAWVQTCTCLLSFSRQPCSLMREPAVLSTTVRHRSMCLTDLSLVRAHSLNKSRSKTLAKGRLDLCPLDPKIQPHLSAVIELARLQLDAYSEEWWQCGCDTGS